MSPPPFTRIFLYAALAAFVSVLSAMAQPVDGTPEAAIILTPSNDPASQNPHAVGLFNRGEAPAKVEANFPDLGLGAGKHRVRHLWRQKNLGKFKNSFRATAPRHSLVLVQIWSTIPQQP